MKKWFFILLIFLILPLYSFAEELTTVAVVDINKVAMVFFKNSYAVKQIESFKQEIQTTLNRLKDELNDLKNKKLLAEEAGNQEEALRLDNDIFNKQKYIQDYYRVKSQQLAEKQKQLAESSTFLQELQNALSYVAENNGYSVILKSTDPNLLWWNKEVDITEKVIEVLTK
ncbi:OmpH family outer membrane protein [Spirochaetia bacterium 38H-sp]|uniref:OmpH family outer membrane protein n=1 Tax=Rarispira pelagica TaxID=3141764 RepID=A0ABU9UAU0_9SPIR